MTIDEIKSRYTRVVKYNNKWACYLTVGCQSFQVYDYTTKTRAKYFARMLAIALEALIKENTHG